MCKVPHSNILKRKTTKNIRYFFYDLIFTVLLIGDENYINQKEYGERIFKELQDFAEEGVEINDIHHDIELVSACDWKGAVCIEGNR